MKILAGRPRDLEDVRSLLEVADGQEVACARAAAELITGRGYNREQNLAAGVDRLLDPLEHDRTEGDGDA